MRLVFLGPPGAGKGTQASRLAERLSVPHISTGDILRHAIKMATPTGIEARKYVDGGELVPFEIILRLVRDRLQEGDAASGWILDGFPRSLDQASAFVEILGELGQHIDRVVYVEVSEAEVVKRLSGRRVCRECGATFHVEVSPPPPDHECGLENIYQRTDDSEDRIRNRLSVYHGETQPLVDHYASEKLLCTVDGEQEMDAVFAAIVEGVGLDGS